MAAHPERGGWRRAWLAACLLAAAAAHAQPEIHHWRTEGGARVYFVAAPELPIVDLKLVFDAGSARDGALPGLAGFTAAMLLEGAGGASGQQIAEGLADLGARVDVDTGRDTASLSLRSLRDPQVLDPALSRLAEVVVAPDFPADAVARVRRARQVGVALDLQTPGGRARRAFYAAAYGEHPYASPPEGTPEGLARIARADLVAFHRRHYVSANAVLALVGDLTQPEARALAARLLDRLPAGEPAPPLPPVAPLDSARTVWIEHPSSQSHVLVGQPAVTRADPDYVALYVGNHALGGGALTSLLGEAVREQRGLAYSVSSRLRPLREDGPFVAGLQTRNEAVHDALAVLRRTLSAYLSDGPEAERLARSKKNISGGFALRMDSNRKILDLLGVIGFHGLPLDYLERFPERAGRVSAGAVRAALASHLDPERMVTVVVGGAAAREP